MKGHTGLKGDQVISLLVSLQGGGAFANLRVSDRDRWDQWGRREARSDLPICSRVSEEL